MPNDFIIKSLSLDNPPPDQRWLWQYHIPMDKFTIVSGDWGAGKTHSFANIVTCVLRREPFPDGDISGIDPGYVLMVTTESNEGELTQVFQAQGCEQDEIDYIKVLPGLQSTGDPNSMLMFDLDAHMDSLQRAVDKFHPIVIFFDPLVEFHSRRDIDAKAIRSLMVLLGNFCERNRVAGIGTVHWNKDSKMDRRYRTSGSQQYSAGVKSVVIVERDPKNKDRRVFHQEKMTLGPEPDDLYFSIESPDGLVIWEKPPQIDLSQEIVKAQLWLVENLSLKPMTPSEAIALSGIPERTLRRARASLGSRIVTRGVYQDYKTVDRWEMIGPDNLWGLGQIKTG